MVSDRTLQYVDDAWFVFMVVNRAEDASGLDGHYSHAKLAPHHATNLRAKVNRCQELYRNSFRLMCHLFIAHRALLSVVQGPNYCITPHLAVCLAIHTPLTIVQRGWHSSAEKGRLDPVQTGSG